MTIECCQFGESGLRFDIERAESDDGSEGALDVFNTVFLIWS